MSNDGDSKKVIGILVGSEIGPAVLRFFVILTPEGAVCLGVASPEGLLESMEEELQKHFRSPEVRYLKKSDPDSMVLQYGLHPKCSLSAVVENDIVAGCTLGVSEAASQLVFKIMEEYFSYDFENWTPEKDGNSEWSPEKDEGLDWMP